MSDAGRWCLPDPARKAHWIAMSSNSYGDGSTRGFDKLPPDLYQPDPALAGYPPPQPAPPMGSIGYGQPGPGQPYGQVGQYGSPAYPPPMPVSPSALPDVPRVYQQMLRGPRYRWWKPLLCLVLVVPLALLMMGLAIVPVLIAGLVTGAPDLVEYTVNATTDIANMGPVGFIYLNLTLIVLIPASGLSIWIVHGVRPGYLSSVAGRIRWRWLLRCIAVIAPLWAVYTLLGCARRTIHLAPSRSMGRTTGHRAGLDALAGSGGGVLLPRLDHAERWRLVRAADRRACRLDHRVGGRLLGCAPQP